MSFQPADASERKAFLPAVVQRFSGGGSCDRTAARRNESSGKTPGERFDAHDGQDTVGLVRSFMFTLYKYLLLFLPSVGYIFFKCEQVFFHCMFLVCLFFSLGKQFSLLVVTAGVGTHKRITRPTNNIYIYIYILIDMYCNIYRQAASDGRST